MHGESARQIRGRIEDHNGETCRSQLKGKQQSERFFHYIGIRLVGEAENSDRKASGLMGLYQPGKSRDLSAVETVGDRKSTRLNSSHVSISYAVFCLKKKKST